jgi:hypothetical protein
VKKKPATAASSFLGLEDPIVRLFERHVFGEIFREGYISDRYLALACQQKSSESCQFVQDYRLRYSQLGPEYFVTTYLTEDSPRQLNLSHSQRTSFSEILAKKTLDEIEHSCMMDIRQSDVFREFLHSEQELYMRRRTLRQYLRESNARDIRKKWADAELEMALFCVKVDHERRQFRAGESVAHTFLFPESLSQSLQAVDTNERLDVRNWCLFQLSRTPQ